MKLNLGCGEFYADGWLNVDLVDQPPIRPDLVILPGLAGITMLADHGPFERIYLGHVLEHLPWHEVVPTLDRLTKMATPDARLAVVGPDVYRCIELVAAGRRTESWLRSVLEDHRHFQPEENVGPGARHFWNCYEERVIEALAACPRISDIEPVRDLSTLRPDWPLVAADNGQMAVTATIP